MKHKLKRLNRGLVLAAVLLVGMIIYIVIDQHNFKTEKPEIESTVKEYVAKLADYNITPEEYQEEGKKYSEKDSEESIKKFEDFADEYWIPIEESGSIYDSCVYKNEFKNTMKEFLKLDDKGYITDFDAELINYKINKDGPNAAVLNGQLNLFYTAKGTDEVITVNGLNSNYSYYGQNDDSSEEGLMRIGIESDCIIYLERTSDGWKISKCENYCYSTSRRLADESEEIE